MRKIIYIAVFACFFYSLNLFSQDVQPSFEEAVEQPQSSSEPSTPVAIETPDEATTASTSESAAPDAGDFEVFNPTEDISEDLSVPFPVDI